MILGGLGVFLLIVVGLLAVPLTLTFRIAWPDAQENTLRVGWAFGLIDARVPLTGAEAEDLQEDDRALDSRRKRRDGNVVAAIRDKPFRQRVTRFVRDSWRAIHKRDIAIRMRVGLGDPADTGQLWAVLGPVSGFLATLRNAAITLEPEFDDAVLEVDGRGQVRVVPLKLIALSLALVASPAFWRGARLMRGA